VSIPQRKVNDDVIGKENAANLNNSHMKYIANKKKVPVTYEAMPYGTVMIVDDVETNLYIAQGLMNLFKLKSEVVTSGKEAVQRIAKGETYDVIFMDHMMPEVDGVRATGLIREIGYKKPIVALTANVLAEQEEMYLSNGFDGFIPKPIELKLLNEVLCKFVRDVHKPNQSSQIGESAVPVAMEPPPIPKISPKSLEMTLELSKAAEPELPDGVPAKPDAALVKLFVKDAKRAADIIGDLLARPTLGDEGLAEYVTMIHGIKSALRNIGERELSKVAETLERHGREGNETEVVQYTPELFDKLQKLIEFYDTK
jgi:CheY-like chemotaxis protein